MRQRVHEPAGNVVLCGSQFVILHQPTKNIMNMHQERLETGAMRAGRVSDIPEVGGV
jgi:hypothetical protein